MILNTFLFLFLLLLRQIDSFSPLPATHVGISRMRVGGFSRTNVGSGTTLKSAHDGMEEVLKLPAVSIKKSLRLSLQLLSMGGLQNEPEPGTWTVEQLDDPPGLSLSYIDSSGTVAITFDDSSISFSRIGSAPSMAFRLQEAVLISKFLLEIEELASGDGGTVAPENRLVYLGEVGSEALADAKDRYNIKNE